MRIPHSCFALLSFLSPLAGQDEAPFSNAPADLESPLKWSVEVPAPALPEVPLVTPRKPAPMQFEVISSRSNNLYTREAPEMPDLPPIEGRIKMTIQRVANPGLVDPVPPEPTPAIAPTDPELIARLQELQESYRPCDFAFISATVYLENEGAEIARTLLRIYPNGHVGKEVLAWSNVNFLHLAGQGGFRVNHVDGTSTDVALLMGISPMYAHDVRRTAERAAQDGVEYSEPQIPEMKDLAIYGPHFLIVEGDEDSPAMDTLDQLHALFDKSGEIFKEQYLAREKARE